MWGYNDGVHRILQMQKREAPDLHTLGLICDNVDSDTFAAVSTS